MGLFDDIKAKGAAYLPTEEALYAEALREIESGQRRDGIWAMAMSESDMDVGKAGAKYIKMRVQSLKAEVTVYIAAMYKAESQTVIAKATSQKELPKFESKKTTGVTGQFIAGFKDGRKDDGKKKEPNKPLGLVGSLLLMGIFPFYAMTKELGWEYLPRWTLGVGAVLLLVAVMLMISDEKKGR